jgi:hypothetical protein
MMVDRTAIISDCGRYRYLLRRLWAEGLPRALFIMLNPSTADDKIDDPTIKALIRWCQHHSYGSFEVVNIFAVRSSDPIAIYQIGDPIGPRNEAVIRRAVDRADIVICAWGAHLAARDHVHRLMTEISKVKEHVFCLGITKLGAPRHPLYIAANQPLIEFSPRKEFRP